MTQRILGDYRLEAPLSGGAMGDIHAALHVKSGERVALKTVGSPRQLNVRSLRREIRALTSLDHPNVVSIHSWGVSRGLPWYAMELIDGISLQRHLSATMPRERWRKYLPVFIGVCDGLCYMHGVGLVHRDIKPANIVIRDGRGDTLGDAVLVDFGLATVSGGGIGREELYKRSEVVGTPGYISPEQVRQDHVDPRTDLYALGCLLYELVVGTPPFPAEIPFVGMMKHVEEQPRVPDEVLEWVPPALVELILALLEKRPQDRPGYASDVADRLAEIGGFSHESEPARTYLHRPEFVGRSVLEVEMRSLAEDLAQSKSGEFVVVRGLAGTGKSRVAIELIRTLHVASHGAPEVFVSERLNASTRKAPFAALSSPFTEIADLCLERGAHFTQEFLGQDGVLVGRLVPVIGELPGIGEIEAPQIGAESLEQATLDAATNIFERRAESGPVVLAIDDLQWADPFSRQWLETLMDSRPWERTPLTIIIVGRDDQDGVYLDELCETPGAQTFRVGRLAAAAIADMARSMFGAEELPGDLIKGVTERSDGRPSLVASWLKSAVARGMMVRENGRWRWAGGPAFETEQRDTLVTEISVRELIAQQLELLDPADRSILELVALVGPRLDGDVMEQFGDDELARVDGLVMKDILEDAGGGDVVFASALMHRMLLDGMSTTRRRELHVRAAALMEAVEAPTAEIAFHLARSGWKDEAQMRLKDAGDSAFTRGDWALCAALYVQLLDIGKRNANRSGEAGARLAIALMRRGDAPEAARRLGNAEALRDEVDDLVAGRIEFAAGLVAKMQGRVEEALYSLRRARSVFEELDVWPELRDALVEMGNCRCRRGDFEGGRDFFSQAHDGARARDDEEGVAIALERIGSALVSSRKYRAASHFLSRAAATFSELHARARHADAQLSLAICQNDQGAHPEAQTAARVAAEVRQNIGDARGAARARTVVGHAALQMGEVREACEELEGAIEALRRVGDREHLAVAHGYLGEAYGRLRSFDAAMDQFVEALGIHHTTDHAELEPYVHLEIAKLHRRFGLYFDAEHHLRRAEETAGDDPLFEIALMVQRGHLELARDSRTSVDAALLERKLDKVQLPQNGAPARSVRLLKEARNRDPARLIHGELAPALPPAFVDSDRD